MHHFKIPMIVTAVTLLVAILVGVAGMAMILNSRGSTRTRNERASQLGAGLGIATGVISAPFWWFAAAKLGKERRARLEAERKSKKRR
jgi:hypothetical protein